MKKRNTFTSLLASFTFAFILSLTFFQTIASAQEPNKLISGAVCRDGWISQSTGSGTCSHHGGVLYWTGNNIIPKYSPRPLPLVPLLLNTPPPTPQLKPSAYAPIPTQTPTVTVLNTPIFVPASAGADLMSGLIGIFIFIVIPVALFKALRK